MLILGLTGSIGMGKSTTAKLFAEAGVPVYDADAAVHKIYQGEGAPVVVVDVPLLYETGGEKRVDAVVVVTTTPELQRERVLARGTMDETKLDSIIARQTPDAEKRKRAH